MLFHNALFLSFFLFFLVGNIQAELHRSLLFVNCLFFLSNLLKRLYIQIFALLFFALDLLVLLF